MTGRDKLLIEGLKAAKEGNYNGIFLLPTGVGKGKLMIEIAKHLDPKNILYLCNTTLLRDKMFKDELAKWDAAYLLNKMELQCYQTACKWVGRRYELLLADEFDAALTPEYIKAITNNIYDKKILVSATLDDAKRKQATKIAPILFERKPKQVIADGVINGVKFYFVNYNLSHEENGMYLHYNREFKTLLNAFRTKEVDAKLESLQIFRKQWMCKLNSSLEVTKWLISNLSKKDEKILVFCGLSAQSDKVCRYSYHSNNDDEQLLKDFDSGKIRVLSVVDKINRGLNIAEIRNIIFESTGRSKTKITQRIGRGQRLDVNETLNVFFLIPHFMDLWGNRKPTVVMNWILESTKDMDLTNLVTINYKK